MDRMSHTTRAGDAERVAVLAVAEQLGGRPALPPYRADATCPKCGHDDISTQHRRSGLDCYYPRQCGLSQFDGEHHDRHCRRCGYGWAEAVLQPAATRGEGAS